MTTGFQRRGALRVGAVAANYRWGAALHVDRIEHGRDIACAFLVGLSNRRLAAAAPFAIAGRAPTTQSRSA
jgi:hypothetical protein